jgi:hypothetical protein
LLHGFCLTLDDASTEIGNALAKHRSHMIYLSTTLHKVRVPNSKNRRPRILRATYL